MRLDQFLDTVCLFKTRSAAAKAIRGGQIQLDGHPAKASHGVRPGETIELVTGARRLVIEVTGVPGGESVSRNDASSFYRIVSEQPVENE